MTLAADPIDDLIDRIVELTSSPQSKPFYRQAVETLGRGRVELELGELRYGINMGRVKDPARYLTVLLKKQLTAQPRDAKPAIPDKTAAHNNQKTEGTFFSPSVGDLFGELKPIRIQEDTSQEDRFLEKVYSKSSIPWVTFVGPDFFTMSTNKAKSDRVMARFRTADGQCIIPMIRGKHSPTGSEHGILTADHGRILGALEHIWVQQGCEYKQFENGAVMCSCKVSIREVARLVGWKSFSGLVLNRLRDKVTDLKLMPFYLEFDAVEGFKEMGLKGYGFTLLGDATVLDMGRKKTEETIIQVMFSDTYSRQLLARRVVSRPKEILTLRSELAFLIRLYLEPILMKKMEGDDHAVELLHLIEILNLPAAGWHQYKSKRKEQFKKAIKELTGNKTIDGRLFNVQIEQGLNRDDFMLVAKLISQGPALELGKAPQEALSHG